MVELADKIVDNMLEIGLLGTEEADGEGEIGAGDEADTNDEEIVRLEDEISVAAVVEDPTGAEETAQAPVAVAADKEAATLAIGVSPVRVQPDFCASSASSRLGHARPERKRLSQIDSLAAERREKSLQASVEGLLY